MAPALNPGVAHSSEDPPQQEANSDRMEIDDQDHLTAENERNEEPMREGTTVQRYSAGQRKKRQANRVAVPKKPKDSVRQDPADDAAIPPFEATVTQEKFNNTVAFAPTTYGKHEHGNPVSRSNSDVFGEGASTSASASSSGTKPPPLAATSSVSRGAVPSSGPLLPSGSTATPTLAPQSPDLHCPICGIAIQGDKYNLDRHVKTVHKTSTSFRCPICSAEVTRKDNLAQHIAKSHKIEKNCPGCGEPFGQSAMRDHLQMPEDGQPPSACLQAVRTLCEQRRLK